MADLTMADFGPVVRRYVGTGQLVTGARSIACDVEAGQYNNGVVLAICTLYDGDPLLGFAIANDQATLEGCLIADGAPLVFNTPMFREMEGRTVAFIGRELVVGSTRDQQVTEVRFQLTNLKTHFRREWDLDGVKVKLEPLPDSRAKLRQVVGGVESVLTAVLSISSSHGAVDVEHATTVANVLCSLLTLAEASVIQWLYRQCIGSQGTVIETYHWSPKLGRRGALGIIQDIPPSDLYTYIESTFNTYRAEQEAWDLGRTIRHYVDAVSDSDHLG